MFFRGHLRRRIERANAWRDAIHRIERDYAGAHGRELNLFKPVRFTEKLQWRKLFDLNPVYSTLSDKLAVRDFIGSRVGTSYLIPLLWSGLPEDLPLDEFEPPYALKSTHASGQVVLIKRGETVDPAQLLALATAWLSEDYGATHDEPGYVNVPRRLMVERLVTTDNGSAPEERRLFVFDGKVEAINTVFVEDGKVRNGAFHTRDWGQLDWHFSRKLDRAFPRPERLDDMIRVAEILGRGLDHIRVDIYDCGKSIRIGELTLYSWSGFARFNPDEADFRLGAAWTLRRPLLRAAAAILGKDRDIPPACSRP